MSDYTGTEGLQVVLDGPVLRLTIDRSTKRNSLTDDTMQVMLRSLEQAQTDERVRAILLTGAGGNFCSGFDIVARNTAGGPKPRVGSIQRRLPVTSNRLMTVLCEVQIPVVAAVRGFAAGIGMQMALAADFCVAAENATFWEVFLERGFNPDSGGTWLLPRLVGVARAKELLMLSERITGARAAELNMIYRAVDDAEVLSTAEALVQRLASGPTVAIGLTKWLIQSGLSASMEQAMHNEAFGMELSSRSSDFREGLKALVEKRKPDFTGQ